MSMHLGLQTTTKESEKRAEAIKDVNNYPDYEDEISNTNENKSKKKKSKENHLFNIHYSTHVYTSNYLIRIFPYSLIIIELQGDGFDSPNRQFYCMNKLYSNTLSQKTDLRESNR